MNQMKDQKFKCFTESRQNKALTISDNQKTYNQLKK